MEQYEQQQKPNYYSPIINFYENRSIFITGGSGFMGKVLIEKLLRSCIGIDKIYILLRHKRNRQPNERLNDLINTPLFDIIRAIDRDLLEKIILVEGDVTMANLGLSEQDHNRLVKDVSVVFHSAATVKFDEPLKQSVSINVTGTKNIIELCRKLPKLSALVHVSTAYANCDKPIIDERVYPTDESPDKLIDMAQWMDEDFMQTLKPKLLRLRPNTYTYTKALAEALLVEQASDLPVVICRPSIVVASWREPFRGWIDNINGPTGILLASGKGLVRSMIADKSLKSDIIPVDTVINLMITLGWYVARNYQIANRSQNRIEATLEEDKKESNRKMSSAAAVAASWDSRMDEQENNNSLSEPNNNDQKFENNNSNNNNNCSSTANLMNSSYNINGILDKGCQQGVRLDDGYSSAPATPDLSVEITKINNSNSSSSIGSSSSSDCLMSACCNRNSKNKNDNVSVTNKNNINNNSSNRNNHNKAMTFSEHETTTIPVFHCTSGVLNPITWKMVQYFVIFWLRIYPSIQVFRYPNGSFEHRRYIHTFYRITLHYLPAYLLDTLTRLSGGKPILVRIFQKFDQAAQVLAAFTTRDWIFKSDNIRNLQIEMSPYDRATFQCDITNLHWETFFMDYVLGVR